MERGAGGFTIVELMITMVVMVILMALGIAGFSNVQANARDNEREQDVQIIARGLEQRYTQGNARYANAQRGYYPSIDEVEAMISGGYTTQVLPGVTSDSLTSPTGGSFTTCGDSCGPEDLTDSNGRDRYVYEPLTASGDTCNDDSSCVKYQLFWKSETDSTQVYGINGLKIVMSKHQ